MAEEEHTAAQEFAEALAAFNTLELTWLLGMAADRARESIERAELEHVRHVIFGRSEEGRKAMSRVDFYKKVIDLRVKWRNAEMEHSAPLVVAALTGRDPSEKPRKKV